MHHDHSEAMAFLGNMGRKKGGGWGRESKEDFTTEE
jgi:hypothetical protein